MERSELAIIIPAFNEEASIGQVVAQAVAFGTVIVVDDASTDKTPSVAKEHGAVVVSHSFNRGYDRALDSGFAKAASLGCRYAVTLDADGQHDPTWIKRFAEHLVDYDLVLGVRPRKQRVSESLFGAFTRLLYGIRDPLCGLKGYRMELYVELGHFDSYESIGTELALYGLRKGRRYVEIDVPIRERRGTPKFGRTLSANYRILRAMWRGLLCPL
jgi:glycosyltransferase involved in cell wall biosynthesis